MKRTHHTHTDQEFLERMDPIPTEAPGIGEILRSYQQQIDERQLLKIETKDVRVSVFLADK